MFDQMITDDSWHCYQGYHYFCHSCFVRSFIYVEMRNSCQCFWNEKIHVHWRNITVISFFFCVSLSHYATICMHILFSLYLSESIFCKDPPFVLVMKVHLCCFLSILFQLQDVFISLCNIFLSLSFYFNYLSIYCISLLFSVQQSPVFL